MNIRNLFERQKLIERGENGVKRAVSLLLCAAALLLHLPAHAAESGARYIDIGNAASEGAFAVFSDASESQWNAENGETYRTLGDSGKIGSVILTMQCAPDAVNYLTVKLWGGDTGEGMLWVCEPDSGTMSADGKRPPIRNGLPDRNDFVELNSLKTSPQYDGGFIYATYLIPRIYTNGKESVRLKIYSSGGSADYSAEKVKEQTAPSRGIYAVYMTQNAYFDPTEFETVTGRLAETAKVSAKPLAEQKEIARTYARRAVETFQSWQIYGQENFPAYMEGMVTRGTGWQKKKKEDADWKDAYYKTSGGMLQQNLTPLNMYEVFALAYQNADELGYSEAERAELLDRIVKGVDFLVRAQGANGGFFSSGGWIGGPDRQNASGNNLTGFGLRSVAKAVVMVYDDVKNNGYLSKDIDSDADGEPDTVRKDAWEGMIACGRDYLLTFDGTGHAPNQDMADIIAALNFDKALSMMESAKTWSDAEVEYQLDIALGFRINKACSSYWVSPKGLILENFGSIQGGYTGDYGIAALEEISQLAEFAEEYYGADSFRAEKYTQLLDKAYDSADKFMFTANASAGGDPTLYAEGVISSRNSYYPGTERYVLDSYAALSRKNKTALKTFETFFAHNKLETASGNYLPSNAHFEDNALSVLKLYLNFDEILSAMESENISDYQYLIEDIGVDEYAWADEMGRNVVIKNGEDKIYFALNWRNPLHSTTYYNTSDRRDGQKSMMNNLARVHHKTDRYDKYGYAETVTVDWSTNTWQLFENHYVDAFMYLNYGDYKILMNSNNLLGQEKEVSYPIPWEELELNGLYKDLISGKAYYFGKAAVGALDGKAAQVAPATTMVLYRLPIPTVETAEYSDGVVSVEITADRGAEVFVYAAEYTDEGRVVDVRREARTVKGKAEITFSYQKQQAANKVKIFVWNGAQQPLFEGAER